MIGVLKQWIITVCTAVFFITAVEIILPSNNLKKYVKFVLGLIMVTVLVKPIIKLFDKNYDMNVYVEKAAQYFNEGRYEDDIDKYKEKSKENTVSTFKTNLEQLCEKKLKQEIPHNNYKAQVEVQFDDKTQTIVIKSVKIGLKQGKVENVRKVHIKNGSSEVNTNNVIDDKTKDAIKNYLSREIGISKDIIVVYKS